MIVVDASVVLDLLLNTPASAAVRRRLFRTGETIHAPYLLDIEVLQVIRRFWLARSIDESRAAEAIEDYLDLSIERYPHELLVARIWELRQNLTAYDASYIALAELLRAPLLTADRRLAKAAGILATVEIAS